MRANVLVPVVAGALLITAADAGAATATTTFNVSAQVAANCLVSADDIDFGSYDGTAALTADGAVKVRCSNGLPFTIALSAGGGSFTQRLLTDGTNDLEYNLYTAASFGTVWGDGTGTTVTVGDVGEGMSATKELTHTVYGQLVNSAANQDAPAGSYSDLITVTVTY
ncbi:MAG TPA: spore coat U domain-containing protein [Steroidobacteraceae bacterium]|nr:spore coat U domain-containing protein [Steroidobacteraceae bacterium]